jgi:chromosome partitioning protein
LEVVASVRETGPQIRMLGIVLNMLQSRSKHSQDVADEVHARLPKQLLFDTIIPRDAAFLEASAQGIPLGLMRKRQPSLAASFDELAREVEIRLDLRLKQPEEDEHDSLFA